MEKDKEILTDDQLKDISGGSQSVSIIQTGCELKSLRECNDPRFKGKWCIWKDGRCIHVSEA